MEYESCVLSPVIPSLLKFLARTVCYEICFLSESKIACDRVNEELVLCFAHIWAPADEVFIINQVLSDDRVATAK